jgi:hypothetical protein
VPANEKFPALAIHFSDLGDVCSAVEQRSRHQMAMAAQHFDTGANPCAIKSCSANAINRAPAARSHVTVPRRNANS